MTDRPILFSAPMVRALLDGRKTQTRRALYSIRKIDENGDLPPSRYFKEYLPPNLGLNQIATLGTAHLIQPGDRLWVKETWQTLQGFDDLKPTAIKEGAPIGYIAGGGTTTGGKTRVSLFMRRWMSRLTLLVTDVRIERLQHISEADSVREGVTLIEESVECPIEAYRLLWNSINGAGAWEANPWVVAISFEVQKRNIDNV